MNAGRWRAFFARRRLLVEIAIVIFAMIAIRAIMLRGVIDGPMPAFEATLLDGSSVSRESLIGEPFVLTFSASWCGVCKAMDGAIDALSEDHRVIRVVSWSGDAAILARGTSSEVRQSIIADPEGALAARFGVRSVPTTFVIDGTGSIRFREVGYTTQLGLSARLWISR